EGLLDVMAAEAIRAHLSVCYLCMKEFEELQQTIKLIEHLPFVEPLRDFAPAIMAALKEQPGYSFQAPVVDVETAEAIAEVSLPRTTTGQERQGDFQLGIFGIRLPGGPKLDNRKSKIITFPWRQGEFNYNIGSRN